MHTNLKPKSPVDKGGNRSAPTNLKRATVFGKGVPRTNVKKGGRAKNSK